MTRADGDASVERAFRLGTVLVLFVAGLAGVAALVVPGIHSIDLAIALIAGTAVSAALRPWRLAPVGLWGSSIVFCIAFTAVLGVNAYHARVHRDLKPQLGTVVTSNAEVAAHLGAKGVSATAFRVRTGVYLTHMEFASANNVQISGYVWQIYPPNTPPELGRGVVFPESVNGGYDNLYPAYDVKRADGTQILGWHFDLTLREKFDYAKYPFDQQDVWLRMWHKDFERGAILVPDFDGYPPWNPEGIYGVEKHFVYSGWDPVFSGFSYLDNIYEAAWGLGTFTTAKPFPELVWSISLQRHTTGPVLNHVVPLVVIYMFTFAILLFMVKSEERSFNILGVLGGLFFLTLINHQQINSVAVSQGMSLLGVASGILYASFFAVAGNGLVIARADVPALEWRNNVLAKLLFLPVTSLILALASERVL
jgi:hypothetical protein